MADADATELQGDGQALGGNIRKKRERKRKNGDGFFSLLFKKQEWNGYERSEGEGKRSGQTATAVGSRSTAA